VNLAIGLEVAALLRAGGFQVLLTRDVDKTVSLEQRVNMTNAYRCADLLISIHANLLSKAITVSSSGEHVSDATQIYYCR